MSFTLYSLVTHTSLHCKFFRLFPMQYHIISLNLPFPSTLPLLLTLRLDKSFSSFHSILFFYFFQSSKPFHSISIFSTIFFNFLNPYTISLNLNHSYYLEISKVKPFLHHFSKIFSNHSNHPNKWDGMGKMPTPNKGSLSNFYLKK